ncbi:MAG TPA: hypothetical protein VFT91_05960, partial [Dehalococcoidia bacterium]|nr:hypothetical protein [Dehalococcoidia bacterium]
VVEQVVAGTAEHQTYGGQPVISGPSSAQGFGLADLLAMRRREAERFLARGGIMALLAHPDVAHPGLGWRRYDWLPAPEGFRWQERLRPGFGSLGVLLEDAGHPFAPYLEAFGDHLSYRAEVDEEAPGFGGYGRVFARSPGGAAVAVELAVGAGRLVLLPALTHFEQERPAIAETLFACFDRFREQGEPLAPDWIRKEVP